MGCRVEKSSAISSTRYAAYLMNSQEVYLTGFTVILSSSLNVLLLDMKMHIPHRIHTIGQTTMEVRRLVIDTSNVLTLANPSIIPMKFTTGNAPLSSKFRRCMLVDYISRFISLCFLIKFLTHNNDNVEKKFNY